MAGQEEAEAGSDGSRRPTASTRSGSSRSAGWPRSSRAAGGSRSRPWWSSATAHGKVGLGLGKAKEVPAAIQKGIEEAKKNLIPVPLAGSTITHQIIGEHGAGRVLLKPAAPGTGVIAGGAGRAILEAAGVHDVLAKSLGSSNPINVARSVINGLQSLKRPEDIARLRGKSAEEVTPGGMLRAYNERNRPTRPGRRGPVMATGNQGGELKVTLVKSAIGSKPKTRGHAPGPRAAPHQLVQRPARPPGDPGDAGPGAAPGVCGGAVAP